MGTTKKPTKSTQPAARPRPEEDEEGKKGGSVRPDEMPEDVLEFIHAIDTYKRTRQRPFPNWSEILEIVKSLGYSRSR